LRNIRSTRHPQCMRHRECTQHRLCMHTPVRFGAADGAIDVTSAAIGKSLAGEGLCALNVSMARDIAGGRFSIFVSEYTPAHNAGLADHCRGRPQCRPRAGAFRVAWLPGTLQTRLASSRSFGDFASALKMLRRALTDPFDRFRAAEMETADLPALRNSSSRRSSSGVQSLYLFPTMLVERDNASNCSGVQAKVASETDNSIQGEYPRFWRRWFTSWP
jgi:hypothetical protein